MKSHTLKQFEEWEDFDRIVHVLEKSLGWESQQKVDGPDARSWSFLRNGFEIWLVFDDLVGMALKCEGESSHLSVIADDIMAVFNYDERKK